MAQSKARQGFAIVTSPTQRGVAFTRYLLKNTLLPVVVADGYKRRKNKAWMLEQVSDIEGADSRLHYVLGSLLDDKPAQYLKQYLRTNLPGESLRLMLSMRRSTRLNGNEETFADMNRHSITTHYYQTAIGYQMLMKHLHGFLPLKKLTPLEVSETDNCKLPPYAIWASQIGHSASISQNTAKNWYTIHSANAASLQLTKTFDNFLRVNHNAISVGFQIDGDKMEDREPASSTTGAHSEGDWAEKIMQVLTTKPPDEARGCCWNSRNQATVP